MNKVILMGRLTRDPELKYSQSANPVAVARYSIAVRRQFTKPGEPDVDFFNIVAFGKAGEFAEKYFQKGQMVAVTGRLQIGSWQDAQGVKRTSVDVVAEEQHFAESRSSAESRGVMMDTPTGGNQSAQPTGSGSSMFSPTNFDEEDDLPF